MIFTKKRTHMIDIVFLLVLIGAFILSAILLILLGANIYRTTIRNMNSNYDTRTAFAYLTEKIEQQDSSGSVSIEKFGDNQSIVLSQEIDGKLYHTYLYSYQDHLMELLTNDGNNISPSAGQEILPCKSFQLSQINAHLYHFCVTTNDGTVLSLYISTHSEVAA